MIFLPKFQLYIEAYDTFFPENRARGRVNIFVGRNSDVIFFEDPASYRINVNEYQALFETIFTVNAIDPDNVSQLNSFISPIMIHVSIYCYMTVNSDLPSYVIKSM